MKFHKQPPLTSPVKGRKQVSYRTSHDHPEPKPYHVSRPSATASGGPGVIVLFMICGIACGFTAMCYAEFASRIPVAGSAYTYAYTSFGEIVAWIIGWALLMEYSIGNIYVAFVDG